MRCARHNSVASMSGNWARFCVDAIVPGERVLLLDDLVATGGSCEAAIRVLEALGAEIVGVGAVIDLPDVGGRRRLEALGHKLVALCAFEGD